MFRGNRDRHYQLMAELRALEAQEAGITAAHVITPAKDKLSLGKALMFLGGLSAVGYFLIFSDKSPFDVFEEDTPSKKRSVKDGSESYEILNQIKYGEMNDMENAQKKQSVLSEQKPASGFLDAALSRASLLGEGGPAAAIIPGLKK